MMIKGKEREREAHSCHRMQLTERQLCVKYIQQHTYQCWQISQNHSPTSVTSSTRSLKTFKYLPCVAEEHGKEKGGTDQQYSPPVQSQRHFQPSHQGESDRFQCQLFSCTSSRRISLLANILSMLTFKQSEKKNPSFLGLQQLVCFFKGSSINVLIFFSCPKILNLA